MTTDIHAAFEAKYKASAQDPACAEELRVFSDGWRAARVGSGSGREAFEAWTTRLIKAIRLKRALLTRLPNDQYADLYTHQNWLAWQAATQARDAEIGGGGVMELPLCATEKYTLRVGQTYRFVPVAGCASCDRLATQARESYPDAPAPQPPRFPWREEHKIARQIRGDGGKERK